MSSAEEVERESVGADVKTTLLEGRMILPGVQTLFGFQLSVLFTEHFQKKLSRPDQLVHYTSLCIVGLTILVVILPAAYHRRVMPGVASRRFARFATRCLKISLLLMTLGMGLNFFLITDVVFESTVVSAIAAGIALLAASGLWFLLPSWSRKRRTVEERRASQGMGSSPEDD